jgi:FKBP-type peptidyl-prolyl cis-trans isomerase FkpA
MTRRRLAALAGMAMSLAVTLAAAQQAAEGEAAEPAAASQAARVEAATPETQPAGAVPVEAAPAVQAGPQLLTEDLRNGFGETARSGMTLTVQCTGWLYEPAALGYRGKQFFSTRESAAPLKFRLGVGQVIKGWDVGIVGMQVGGLRRLVIPPEMAYGSRGFGNGLIPPDSTLVFEVELLGVESASFVQGTK